MEEIEREPIMQVQAESPTFQDTAEIFGINATILRRNESITIRHVYISDADSSP